LVTKSPPERAHSSGPSAEARRDSNPRLPVRRKPRVAATPPIGHSGTASAPHKVARAVGYVRVSTGSQAREGFGLADQESVVRSFCAREGLALG